jgi:hypothetical protein
LTLFRFGCLTGEASRLRTFFTNAAATAMADFARQFNTFLFLVPSLRLLLVGMGFIEVNNLLVHRARYAQRFARQHFPGCVGVAIDDNRRRRFMRAVAVIIIFEVFEYVADVQKRIAIQADVDECRLHAGQDPCNFSFVDAADECEFFFAFDVDFDELAFF